MNDYTLVEKMIPAQLLLQVGIYMQSAAHLELAVWQIVMAADNSGPPTVERFRDHLATKAFTPSLIKSLRRSAELVPPQLGIRIKVLASRISEGLETRNLVAHGALIRKGDSVAVSHYFSRGKKADRVWYEAQDKITARQAREAIDEIDRLLREAIDIHTDLRRLRGHETPTG